MKFHSPSSLFLQGERGAGERASKCLPFIAEAKEARMKSTDSISTKCPTCTDGKVSGGQRGKRSSGFWLITRRELWHFRLTVFLRQKRSEFRGETTGTSEAKVASSQLGRESHGNMRRSSLRQFLLPSLLRRRENNRHSISLTGFVSMR